MKSHQTEAAWVHAEHISMYAVFACQNIFSSNWKKASSLVGQTACLNHDLWANNRLNGFSVRYSSFLNN